MIAEAMDGSNWHRKAFNVPRRPNPGHARVEGAKSNWHRKAFNVPSDTSESRIGCAPLRGRWEMRGKANWHRKAFNVPRAIYDAADTAFAVVELASEGLQRSEYKYDDDDPLQDQRQAGSNWRCRS
jgi:hypothetical protein